MKRMAASAIVLGALGYRSGRSSGASGLTHRIALVTATAAVVMTGWLLVSAGAVFAARDARIIGREPVLLAVGVSQGAVARYLPRGAFHHDRSFLVIYLAPLTDSAVPPPGLPRWPQPGEAFLSPALLAADPDGVLQRRYGIFGGAIGMQGLAEPDEWLVYVRPSNDEIISRYDGRFLVSGFGHRPGADETFRTISNTGRSPDEFYWLLLLVVAVPTSVLVTVAVRSGSEQRDRRVAMLHALGAPRRAVGWIVAGESVLPVVAGSLIAGLAAWLTTLLSVRLPVASYQVLAGDLAHRQLWVPLLVIASCVLMLLLVAAAHYRVRRLRGTRPQVSVSGWQTWPRIVFLLALSAAVWSATNGFRDGGAGIDSDMTLIFIPAAMITLATLPSAVSALARPLGRLTAAAGWRWGRVDALVAGRWLAYRPAALSRVCGAFVVGLGALTLLQVWVSQNADPSAAAPVRLEIADQLVTVRATRPELDASRFIAAVGTDRVLTIEQAGDGTPIIVGTCPALRIIGEMATCPHTPAPASQVFGRLTTLGNAIKTGDATILLHAEPLAASTSAGDTSLAGFLVHNPDGEAGFAAIAEKAHHILAMPDVHTARQHTISGSLAYATLFTWLWTFAALGLLLLVTTALFGAIDAFLNQARSLGPLGAMHTGKALYIKIATWNLALPLAAAGVAGGAVAALLGFLLTRLRASGSLSWDLLTAGVLVVATIGIIIAGLCGQAATRLARTWHPHPD